MKYLQRWKKVKIWLAAGSDSFDVRREKRAGGDVTVGERIGHTMEEHTGLRGPLS